MAQSGVAVAFGRPSRTERVRTEHDDERWRGVNADIKAYHMVGRTFLGRRCVWRHADVVALVKKVGFDSGDVWNWDALGVSQKIDIIATDLLRRARQERLMAKRESGGHGWENDALSVGQWWMRHEREIPMPLGGMEALLEFSGRARVWRP